MRQLPSRAMLAAAALLPILTGTGLGGGSALAFQGQEAACNSWCRWWLSLGENREIRPGAEAASAHAAKLEPPVVQDAKSAALETPPPSGKAVAASVSPAAKTPASSVRPASRTMQAAPPAGRERTSATSHAPKLLAIPVPPSRPETIARVSEPSGSSPIVALPVPPAPPPVAVDLSTAGEAIASRHRPVLPVSGDPSPSSMVVAAATPAVPAVAAAVAEPWRVEGASASRHRPVRHGPEPSVPPLVEAAAVPDTLLLADGRRASVSLEPPAFPVGSAAQSFLARAAVIGAFYLVLAMLGFGALRSPGRAGEGWREQRLRKA